MSGIQTIGLMLLDCDTLLCQLGKADMLGYRELD